MRVEIKSYFIHLTFFSLLLTLYSCKSGTVNLFKAASPHEAYQRSLVNSGLDKTVMGSSWTNVARSSIQKALNITIPFKETGYFAADKISASAYTFNAVRGQKIQISVQKKNLGAALLYLDLWKLPLTTAAKPLASADTLNNVLQLDIDDSGQYLIRLQPELLSSMEYTLEITSGPSLGFPTRTGSNQIKSFFGDGRDENSRKHEGVDIFGNFRSPVIATSNGIVTRVNENNLGGKVVWFRPEGKNYTLYYAHLDQQIATEGRQVNLGDTLGLMGNTGNARTTPTHLHFGIYTSTGAVDPFPYINQQVKLPVGVSAPSNNLHKTLRTTSRVNLHLSPDEKSGSIRTLASATIVEVEAATGHWYRTALPDGTTGFIAAANLVQVTKALTRLKLPSDQPLFDRPDEQALVKLNLSKGQGLNILGNFENYQLVSDENMQVGWIKK